MDKINFCVSILNGQFKAASFRRGSVAGLWEGPELREDFSDLPARLKESLERTKADGKMAAVVMTRSSTDVESPTVMVRVTPPRLRVPPAVAVN